MGKVSLIVAGVKCNDPINGTILGIGKDNKIPWNCSEDLKHFRELTNGSTVIMGRKTFESIGKPLPNRHNIVLSRNPEFKYEGVTVINDYNELGHYIFNGDIDIFIIGGTEIYKKFINSAKSIYLTEILGKYECDTFFPEIPSEFIIKSSSDLLTSSSGVKYRFIEYTNDRDHRENNSLISHDQIYIDHCKNILKNGNERSDRTGTGTVSVFGTQLKFDISTNFPLLTTKFVSFKSIIEELLWILRGDTDVKILEEKGIKIWTANTTREFLDKQGKFDYPEGILQYGYGYQLRNQNGSFDQLEYILNLLKTDPFSRRIMWNLWTPSDISRSVLPPCHILFQLYVEEINGIKHLSGMVTMRSNDVFLGKIFNICSYSALIYILAKKTGMMPKDLVFSTGDDHIYNSHLNQVTEQINRSIRSSPIMKVNDSVIDKDFSDITFKDFELIGYYPHPSISAPMAI